MKNLTQWKTTILGLLTVVISILVGFGIITPDQSAGVSENSVTILEAVFAAITGITGLIAIFSAKDVVE